jgi:hypothetical protein
MFTRKDWDDDEDDDSAGFRTLKKDCALPDGERIEALLKDEDLLVMYRIDKE